VSSTHIAVGGVFGVGFLREYLSRQRRRTEKRSKPAQRAEEIVTGNSDPATSPDWEKQRAKLNKARIRKLVRRTHLLTIVSAWVVTVPLTALISAILFFVFVSVA
jgi:PiT family inorganic phosphate transporter